MSNFIMRALYSNKPDPLDKKFDLFKAVFFSTFFKTLNDNPANLVLCCLDSESWRKSIYPEYKSGRAAKRAQSVIDFTEFFKVWENLVTQLIDVFSDTNIKFIKVDHAECDDIIGVVTKYHQDWDITNVSSDKDFYQLMKYKNYKQFDPIKKSFITSLNPETELLVKIIVGDSGDSISGLQRGVGVKTAEKIINTDLQGWLEKNELTEKFNLNTQLISFDAVPLEHVTAINEKVNEISYIEQPSARKFAMFTANSGIGTLSVNQTDFMSIIQNIK